MSLFLKIFKYNNLSCKKRRGFRSLLLALCLPWAASLQAADPLRPLADFTFSGFIQGRLTGQLYPVGGGLDPLTDQGEGPGGEALTQALIKRLEFSLGTALPWPGWFIQTSAAATGSKTQFTDLYLSWKPAPEVALKAGRFRVPFGIDPQTSSAKLDFIERPLIYGFGNFGWAGPLGLGIVGERDYGLRADWTPPPGFAGFAPSAAAACVLGNGLNVEAKSPTQVMGRLGVASLLALDDLRHEFSLGVSGSLGHNRLLWRAERYLPIGTAGPWAGNPAAGVTATDLGDRGEVSVLGADFRFRVNALALCGEAAARRLGPYASRGYYIAATIDAPAGDGWLTAAARWDEAVQGYADGAHAPDRPYRAATLGVTWRPEPAWRAQINYIALLLDEERKIFPGSDLVLAQVQYSF